MILIYNGKDLLDFWIFFKVRYDYSKENVCFFMYKLILIKYIEKKWILICLFILKVFKYVGGV